MKLNINDRITINELQKQFNREFPYLKIEFFDIPHPERGGLAKSHMYPATKAIGACRKTHEEGELEITAKDTVEKIEKAFWDRYGLSVEIFRKSGSLWIETSLSNGWTLELQNDEGKEFSEHKYDKRLDEEEDIMDRDKWE